MWEKAYEAYQTGCKVVWSTRQSGFEEELARLHQTAGMKWRDEPALRAFPEAMTAKRLFSSSACLALDRR